MGNSRLRLIGEERYCTQVMEVVGSAHHFPHQPAQLQSQIEALLYLSAQPHPIHDAISDQLVESVRHDTRLYDVSVELEPLVRRVTACQCLLFRPLTVPWRSIIRQCRRSLRSTSRRPYYRPQMILKDLRAASVCRGDVTWGGGLLITTYCYRG